MNDPRLRGVPARCTAELTVVMGRSSQGDAGKTSGGCPLAFRPIVRRRSLSGAMRTPTRIWLAIGAMVPMCLVLLLPLSLAAITFLRERMHLYCGFARVGADDPGSWYCSDGIGYILPGIITGFWVGVLLLAVALATAILLPRPLLASRVLAVVGIAGLGFTVATSLVADSGRSPTDDAPPDTWTSVMTVPSVLFAVATVALVMVAISREGRARATGSLAGARRRHGGDGGRARAVVRNRAGDHRGGRSAGPVLHRRARVDDAAARAVSRPTLTIPGRAWRRRRCPPTGP